MQNQMLIRASLTARRQAAELGCEMAAEDRSVSPDLDNACRYADYREFRDANRERWEHSEAFVRLWQERLFRLAEKEGNRLGLRLDDLMSSWDRWYDEIVIPLQNVFWAGWERSYDFRDGSPKPPMGAPQTRHRARGFRLPSSISGTWRNPGAFRPSQPAKQLCFADRWRERLWQTWVMPYQATVSLRPRPMPRFARMLRDGCPRVK